MEQYFENITQNLISENFSNWLEKSLNDLGQKGIKPELAFTTKINEVILVIIIFESIEEAQENQVFDDFQEALKANDKKRHNASKDWEFNLRIFDKQNFLNALSRFDPEILTFLVKDVQIILGQENYEVLKTNFLENYGNPPIGSVLLPYWEDELYSWEILKERIKATEVQITRCFLNSIKLYHVFSKNQRTLNVEALTELNNLEELKTVFQSIDFLKEDEETGFSKEKLFEVFFKEQAENLQNKIDLISEFYRQLFEWMQARIHELREYLPLTVLLDWLLIFNNYCDGLPNKEQLKDFSFNFLKSISLSYEKDSEHYKNIQQTAKKIGLDGF